jgi:phosphoribosylglycinamide formyltransferase-1
VKKTRIAIFASGAGTNARTIISYVHNHATLEISLVVSTNLNAGVVQVAAENEIPCFVLENNEANDAAFMLNFLEKEEIDFIVLAGYMRKIPAEVTRAFENRIINIHPALLPKFGGKGMYGHHVHAAVKSAGEKQTGITIHFVNEHYDEGNIIFQASCEISDGDTAEDIQKKVHILEHQHYPSVIEKTILSLS